MVRVQNYECVACSGTGATNAYTKRDVENPNEYKYNKRTKNVLNKMSFDLRR